MLITQAKKLNIEKIHSEKWVLCYVYRP